MAKFVFLISKIVLDSLKFVENLLTKVNILILVKKEFIKQFVNNYKTRFHKFIKKNDSIYKNFFERIY